MQIRTSVAVLAIAAAASAAGHAHAVVVLANGQSIGLSSLLTRNGDRTVQIDDKAFTFQSVTSSTFSLANFSIRAYVSAGTNQWGLHDVGFDIVGPFADSTPGNGMYADMNIRYTVEVLPAAYAADVSLRGIGLSFDGAVTGTGSIARVDETVFDLDRNAFMGNLAAFAAAGPPPSGTWSGSLDFTQMHGVLGYRALEVNKNIKFLATAGGSATATFVRQEFSQVMLPAPGAVALLGVGTAFARGRRRR
ncbi:MAG: hypothetical protein FGM39_01155 [Phycisphaerales bacterium]|nr:hypothetical protein [Phycisphaerales bacterium]